MTTPDARTHPGYEPVDADAVARVRAAQDTTGIAGTDAEIALPPAPVGTAQGEYLTRSEEQLRVGTERVAVGRARLEKVVVTEEQTVTVQVSHDEVRLVREPIADGTTLADLPVSDGVPEIILTEERIVVTKVIVPVERVRLETETVTEQRDVTDTVRKERIEFDSQPTGNVDSSSTLPATTTS